MVQEPQKASTIMIKKPCTGTREQTVKKSKDERGVLSHVSASRERAVIPKLVRRPVVGAGRIGSREKIRRRHCYAIGIRRGRDQDGAATCGPIPTHPIRRRVPGRQQPVGGGARPVVAFGIAQNASPKKIGS